MQAQAGPALGLVLCKQDTRPAQEGPGGLEERVGGGGSFGWFLDDHGFSTGS